MQTFTGLEYIKIDIANNYGLDKLVWEDRIKWVDTHLEEGGLDMLFTLANQADNPMLYTKAVYGLHEALEGIPTGYICSLDATASGLQIMAALSGCHKTAANTNLINTGERVDIYQKIADSMGMPRAIVKKPVMTFYYGSEKQPESVFGENTPELEQFYKALLKESPGGVECMDDIQSLWDPEATEYSWVLPDGHTVVMKVMQMKDFKVEVDELAHATFTYRMPVNKAKKKGKSLAANVIHSIDGWIVREMYRRANKQGFDILTIHDSFFCSPNHMNKLRQNYIDIFAELADMNLLETILQSISGTKGKHTKISNNLSTSIRQAEYALS